MTRRLIVYSDGASRGNPGRAAIGAVLMGDRKEGNPILAEISESIGHATNNEAEYRAAIAGLEAAARIGADELVLRADSLLLVRQLQGRWKLKATHLRPLFDQATALLGSFGRVRIEHVAREVNTHADALANQALDR